MAFAEKLLNSTSFIRFIDGYLEEDITNFDIVNSILCNNLILNKRYKFERMTLRQYDEDVKNAEL